MESTKVSLKAEGQAFLVNKALSILVAMGDNRPKTLEKLTNALNIRPCTKVTPFINPLDGIDIVNKLSDNVPPTIKIQQIQQKVFVSQSEADDSMWKEADISAAISGRFLAMATAGSEHFGNIAHQTCSWLTQKQEGDKKLLLDELARQAMFPEDCDPQSVVHRLQNQGFLRVTDDNGRIVYNLPSYQQMKQIKSFLANHVNMVKDYKLMSRLRPTQYGSTYDEDIKLPEGISSAIPDMRALIMLYETSPHKRPCKISDLHKEIAGFCRTLYVVPPSQIFADPAYKKYVKRREIRSKNKRQRRGSTQKEHAFEFAIGVQGICVEQMMLTPEGLLGIPLESQTESPTKKKRRRALTRGKVLCTTLVKTVAFTAQKKGTTPVEANKLEKKEMLKLLENWLESFHTSAGCDEGKATDTLPTYHQICEQLIRLCIGNTRDLTPSSLICQLQQLGWLSVNTMYPYQVSYNLPATNKNAPWLNDARKVEKKSRMLYLSYLKHAMPVSEDDRKVESNNTKRKREPYYRQDKRTVRNLAFKKQKVSDTDDSSDDEEYMCY